MLSIALISVLVVGIDPTGLILPYLRIGVAITGVCVLLWLFFFIATLALAHVDQPFPFIIEGIKARLPLLLLPAIVLPLFLAAFTTVKTAIPFVVGYGWERFWADADRLLFRDDVWRITHGMIGPMGVMVLEWFYTVAWGLALFFSSAFVALFASRRTVAIFFTAMFGTWLIGGVLGAYAFSAAGPVFAHIADPTMTESFRPLRSALRESLAPLSPILLTQEYLQEALHSRIAVKGGGISAMPSMHLGVAFVYVIAARRSAWLIPALLFCGIIFVGSAYFGYHYLIDGIIAAPIAWACWKAAELYYAGKHGYLGPTAPNRQPSPEIVA